MFFAYEAASCVLKGAGELKEFAVLILCEYIHYVLSWDCRLTVSRGWSGTSLDEFSVTSERLEVCKMDGTGNPMHYVQAEPGKIPFLFFMVYFQKEKDMYIWRIVRININAIAHKKRLRRTILDSLLTEYSTLYSAYKLRSCTYHSQTSLYCFWQQEHEQWGQKYNLTAGSTSDLEYRAAEKPFYFAGNGNFGRMVGSLPGEPPRMLLFDPRTPEWLYEVAVNENTTATRRRVQEMRYTAKVPEELLKPLLKPKRKGIRPAPPASPPISPPASPPASESRQMPAKQEFLWEYAVIILYGITIAFALAIKLLFEACILVMDDEEIQRFEATVSKFLSFIILYGITIAFALAIKLLFEACILVMDDEEIQRFEATVSKFLSCMFPH
ncbi:unnamed protein product [Gongylonema pulchrum]|uniref:Anoctamin n=1 Tax=Gongylonema pulchrum TaxID=637853 RepID=A0A183DY99_9BILA|nr:unnamed protein product [Gongylonema pulchrum]